MTNMHMGRTHTQTHMQIGTETPAYHDLPELIDIYTITRPEDRTHVVY